MRFREDSFLPFLTVLLVSGLFGLTRHLTYSFLSGVQKVRFTQKHQEDLVSSVCSGVQAVLISFISFVASVTYQDRIILVLLFSVITSFSWELLLAKEAKKETVRHHQVTIFLCLCVAARGFDPHFVALVGTIQVSSIFLNLKHVIKNLQELLPKNHEQTYLAVNFAFNATFLWRSFLLTYLTFSYFHIFFTRPLIWLMFLGFVGLNHATQYLLILKWGREE